MSGAYSWQSVRRYPLAPVLEVLRTRGLTATEMYDATGLHGSSWKAAVENGLIPKAADRVATQIGRHPIELWPSWDRDAAEDELRRSGKKCDECGELYLPYRRKTQRFCSYACGRRFNSRRQSARRRATAEGRRENVEKVRRWREGLSPAARRAQAAKHAAWQRENWERVLAGQNRYKRERYRNDPEYRERIKARERERYWRKKSAGRMDEAA